MDPKIKFNYDGVDYTVPIQAYELNKIVLPDGRMLEATTWLESYPPIPGGLHEVPHIFSGQSPVEIAKQMNGVIAEVATRS